MLLRTELPAGGVRADGELTPSQTPVLPWAGLCFRKGFISLNRGQQGRPAQRASSVPCQTVPRHSLICPRSFSSEVGPQLGVHSRPSVQSGRAPAGAAELGCLTPRGRLPQAGKEPAAWGFGGDVGAVGGDSPVPSVSAQGLLPTPPGSSGRWEPGTVRDPGPGDGAAWTPPSPLVPSEPPLPSVLATQSSRVQAEPPPVPAAAQGCLGGLVTTSASASPAGNPELRRGLVTSSHTRGLLPSLLPHKPYGLSPPFMGPQMLRLPQPTAGTWSLQSDHQQEDSGVGSTPQRWPAGQRAPA